MTTARWRRILVLPAVFFALAGCAMQEGTQNWYNATDGSSADAGAIAIRNVVVVASEDDEATVLATFVNRSDPDELVEVVVGETTATPEIGSVQIPAGSSASIGPDAASRVDANGSGAEPGHIVNVEFRFESAPRTSVAAVVQETTGLYADALLN